MIVHNLRLTSYGKFKDKTISFSEGINYIYGENEAGKSTIMAFIKAMLYGFSGRGAEGDRKRFIPWDGTVLSGEMEVTLSDGRRVIINRTSGKTPAQDKCSVIDAVSGEPCVVDFSSEIGLGENAFLKTVFIRQNNSHIDGGDEELTDKLLNLAGGSDADVGYEEAAAYLKDRMRELKHLRGDGGKINELTAKITAINSAIEKEEAENRMLLGFFAEEKQLKYENEKLEEEILDLRKRLASAKAGEKLKTVTLIRKKYTSLREAEKEAMEALRVLEERQNQLKPFETEIDPTVFSASPDPTPLEKTVRKTKKQKIGTLIFSALSITLAAGLLFFGKLLYSVIVFSLALLGFSFFGLLFKTQRNAENIILEMENKERICKDILARYGCATIEEYMQKRSERLAIEEKINGASEKLDFIRNEIENIVFPSDMQNESDMVPSDENPLEIENELRRKQDVLFSKKQRAASVDGYIKGSREGRRTPDILYAERREAEEQLTDAENEFAALKLAADTLDEVFAELSRDFTPKISEKASQYLSAITGKDEKLLLDKKYAVTMGRDSHRPLQFFSGGTIDQAYFAVRLAVSELLMEERNVPLFLDDSFIQYDDGRENNTISLLKRISKNRQIFWFSCKNRETENINRITI